MEITKQQIIHTDVLIIGGGTAGCYAALTIREKSDAKIIIAEKANIKRSGCLAAGVNAINAYIVKGRKPQDYVDYARKDADEIVRGDLLLTMSERLNEVTSKMEQLGLVILKDENGEYVEKYIEVKSTKDNEGTPIDITSDEIDFAKKHIDNYYLYRIINSESKDRYLKIIRGKDLFNNTEYNFVPTRYKIYSN